MAVELKTKKRTGGVGAFLSAIPDPEQRKDARALVSLIEDVTKETPTMWGTSIVGFGEYHYKYASGHEGDMCIIGFSPRKANLTLYIMPGYQNYSEILKTLGPYKSGKACLYIKRLSDVHLPTLKKLIKRGYEDTKKKYGV